jgi:hypothetical protein
MIASYNANASAVKMCNATSSLVRFEIIKIFSFAMKNAVAYCNVGVVVENKKKSFLVFLKNQCYDQIF